MDLARISQVVPSQVTIRKRQWYLCNAVPCSVTTTSEHVAHEDEINIAKAMMKTGDGISSFYITHSHRRTVIRRGTCSSEQCKCRCMVLKAVDGYLGMYLNTNHHDITHVASDKKLSLQEVTFVSNNVSTRPTDILSMMVSNNIINKEDLNKKKKMVQYHVYNQRKKIKESINIEWNLKLAKEFIDAAVIDVNTIDKESINRSLEDKFSIMRNLYILDHDMHNNDEWTYIIFTTKSALKVLFEGNIQQLWGDGKVSCDHHNYNPFGI